MARLIHIVCEQLLACKNVFAIRARKATFSIRTYVAQSSLPQKPLRNLKKDQSKQKVISEDNFKWETEIEKVMYPRIIDPDPRRKRTQNMNLESERKTNGQPSVLNSKGRTVKKETPTQKKYQLWQWIVHNQLIKSVVFPPVVHAPVECRQEVLQELTTEKLMSLAQGISSVNKDSMKIIAALWRRLDSLSVEEMLTIADIFFHNHVSVPWYTSALISYIDEMFESFSFTPIQLTRLTFHIHYHGSAPPALFLAIEERMSKILEDFDINLAAHLCCLFFVGKNRIKSPILMDRIADKLLQEFGSVQSPCFPMLMKTFRFSNFIKVSFFKRLGDKLVASNYLQKLNSPNQVMHFAFTYGSVRVSHPHLFYHILTQCDKQHEQPRLKDLAKILWACGTLVTNQICHFERIQGIVTYLRSSKLKDQVRMYPDNMMELLTGLALLNIYPQDLIDMVFEPSIIQILLGLSPDREKFIQMDFLDHCISIECPDYTGHRMLDNDRRIVTQHLKNFSPELDIELRKSVSPAVSAIENAFGPEVVECKFVLPHFRTSDILLTYDRKEDRFVKPVTESLTVSLKNMNSVSDDRFQKVVLILQSLAQTSYDNQLLGMVYCKVRQLTVLGYKVIMVDADEAMSYTLLDRKSTQKLLLAHISSALGTDVTKCANYQL